MKNQLKRSRILNGILAGALALVVVGSTAVVGAVSDGFQDWGRLSAPVQVQTDGAEEMKSGFELSNVKENGVRLMSASIPQTEYENYGVSPLAESAIMLTAAVTPANATYKQVDWGVRWKNASSAWASGKTVTDYVTVATATDGAGTATVSCLKAFGEQIEVVATARDNTTKTATCTVDYRKRITEVTKFDIVDEDYHQENYLSVTGSNNIMNTLDIANEELYDDRTDWSFTAVYSDYTIDNSVSGMSMKFVIDQEVWLAFEEDGRLTFQDDSTNCDVVVFGNLLANCFELSENSNYVPTLTTAQKNIIIDVMSGFSVGKVIGRLHINFSMTGGNLTYTKSVPVVLGEDCTKVYVSGVSLNQTNFVF